VYRAPLVILSLLLAFGANAAARTAGRPTPRTLAEVRGSITALAQNARRVAWIVPHAPCGRQVQILTLPRRQPVSVGSRRGPSCADSAGFGDIGAVSLASGGRVLWQALAGHGNTELDIDLFRATPRAPAERLVAGFEMSYDATNPDDYWQTHGWLAAAADGETILVYGYRDIGGYHRESPAIYRLVGGRLRQLVKVKSPAGLAVRGSRFAVVTNSPHCCSFTPIWSHDGKRLAWIYDGGLWTIRADGTEARQLAAQASHPSWSRDDARIVFDHGADRQRGVYRVDAAGGDLRRLAAGTSPAWSPDGSAIAFVRGQHVYAINPDGTGERKLTTATRPTTGPLSWSPDSTRIAVARGGDIYSVRVDGAGQTRVTTSPHPEGTPAWSPDGTKIAYVGSPRPDGWGTIYVVNEHGTGVTRLSPTGSAYYRSPSWSPDSSRIAFVDADGAFWVVNAGGGGARQLGGNLWDSPQWSPDGSTIAVGDSDRNTGVCCSNHPGLWLVSATTGKARKITPNRSTVEVREVATGRPTNRFTIDGRAKAIAFGSGYEALLVDHEPGLRIELYDLNGRLRTAAAVPASFRTVSAAGNSVVFAAGRVIDRLDARSGAVTQLTTASRAPVGLTIEGHRVVWAENAAGRSRVRAVTAP
jgi:Tol biopolymer transport system component